LASHQLTWLFQQRLQDLQRLILQLLRFHAALQFPVVAFN
jgi:hypothetical protein